jgi:hypothetical protein
MTAGAFSTRSTTESPARRPGPSARNGDDVRKIISGLFITLDGVIEGPQRWNPPYYNDEMTQVVQAQLADADLHLYGLCSYELFRAVFTGPNRPPDGRAPLRAGCVAWPPVSTQ